MQRWKSTARIATAVAMILALAACGSDEDSGGASANLTGDPIKLMVVAPENVSGSPSHKPQAQAAVRAAVAEFNAAGGVKGRPFEVEFCNEGYDANVATACARKAIDGGFTAVVGSYFQQPSNVYDILGEAGIPVIGSFPLQPQDYQNPNSYLLGGGGVMAYAGVSYKLAQDGAKRASALTYTDNPSSALSVQYIVEAMKSHGIEVNPKIAQVKIGSPDAAAPTSEALEFKPDAIIAPMAAPDYAKVITAARQAGSDVRFGGSTVTILPLIEQMPDMLEGTVLANDFPIEGPLAESYTKAFKEFGDGDILIDDLSIGGYLAVRLIYDLAKDLDKIDGPSLKAALDKLEGYTFGPLRDFGWGGDPVFKELPRLRNLNVTVGKVEGGKAVFESEPVKPLTDDYIAAVDALYANK